MTTTLETIQFEIVPNDLGLDLQAKNSLELAFSGFFQEAARWKKEAETITDSKLARTARLEIKSLRVQAEKKRKELKEDSLRMGKAIDGANNILLSLIVPIETHLDNIEKAEERRIAAELKAELERRVEIYTPYHDEAMPFPELSVMDDTQFNTFVENAKALLEMKKQAVAKAELERIEKERIEAEEREAQRLENIRLKAEAEAREKQIAIERAEAEKLRLEQEAKAAKERAEIEAKAKAEAEAREKAEAEARRLKEEDEARKAKELADELLAKEKAKKAASAPDKDKLALFAEEIRNLKLPEVKTNEAKEVVKEINQKVKNFAAWIEDQIAQI